METKSKAMAGAALLLLLTSSATAETREFRIGDLAVSLLNVLGINLLDFTSAIPEIIYLFTVLGLAYLVYRTLTH